MRGKKTKAASVQANRLFKERNKEEKEKPNLPKIIESRMQPATSFPKTRPFMAMRTFVANKTTLLNDNRD